MDTVRPLVIGLTSLAVILLVWQFLAKKGTPGHKIRGHLIGIFSLASVVINTAAITLERDLIWDLPFIIHFSFGTSTLLGLIFTSISGHMLDRNIIEKITHRRIAILSLCLYILTLMAAAGLHIFRN